MADNLDRIAEDLSDDETAQMEGMRTEETESPPAADPPEPAVPGEGGEAAAPDPAESATSSEDAAGGEPEKTTVPYGALREERDKRQGLQRDLDAAQARMGQMESTFQEVMNRLPQQPEADPMPDFEVDPDAHNKAMLERIEGRLDQQDKARKQTADERRKEGQARQFLDAYGKAVQEYSKDAPDMSEAYDFVLKTFDDEMKMRGYSDDAERQKILEFEEEQIVVRAFRDGVNPAERIYKLAQSRGYKKAEQSESQEQDKLDKIARTQAASASLATAGGEGGEPPTTLQRLSELDGDDFDKAWNEALNKGLLG